MRLDKAKIEKIMDAAHLRLEKRVRVQISRGEPYEVFIADGESKPPHFRFQRLGLDPTDFPLGCFVTMWWLMQGEDKLVCAGPAFYEKNHDAFLTDAGRKQARINRAAAEAAGFLEKRKVARRKLGIH